MVSCRIEPPKPPHSNQTAWPNKTKHQVLSKNMFSIPRLQKSPASKSMFSIWRYSSYFPSLPTNIHIFTFSLISCTASSALVPFSPFEVKKSVKSLAAKSTTNQVTTGKSTNSLWICWVNPKHPATVESEAMYWHRHKNE